MSQVLAPGWQGRTNPTSPHSSPMRRGGRGDFYLIFRCALFYFSLQRDGLAPNFPFQSFVCLHHLGQTCCGQGCESFFCSLELGVLRKYLLNEWNYPARGGQSWTRSRRWCLTFSWLLYSRRGYYQPMWIGEVEVKVLAMPDLEGLAAETTVLGFFCAQSFSRFYLPSMGRKKKQKVKKYVSLTEACPGNLPKTRSAYLQWTLSVPLTGPHSGGRGRRICLKVFLSNREVYPNQGK